MTSLVLYALIAVYIAIICITMIAAVFGRSIVAKFKSKWFNFHFGMPQISHSKEGEDTQNRSQVETT